MMPVIPVSSVLIVYVCVGTFLCLRPVGSNPGFGIRPACRNCTRRLEVSDEKRLIRQLLSDYSYVGKNGRPVINGSSTISVEFGLGLIQMDLDENYKVLKMSMWAKYRWKDEYLRWDPSDFNGVETVRLESTHLWLPDIMLYNSADPKSEIRDVLAVVSYDGTIVWVPHQIFKSSCSLDVTNFPFDYQNCHMWFGSWTHTRKEVDVNMAFEKGIDLSTFQSDYLESSDWQINDTYAEKAILPSANDTPSYAVLKFQLSMKRKPVFSSYILTLPCVFLACLTLVVFWLPPDRPDRTALAMSIFASFLLLLLILVEAAPPTASSVPVLGVYYCFNLVIIMVSVFLSSLVVNICRAGESTAKVPRWLKVLTIDYLSHILFLRSESEQTSGLYQSDITKATSYEENIQLEVLPTERNMKVTCNGNHNSYTTTTTIDSGLPSGLDASRVESELRAMRQSLSHIKSNLVQRTHREYKQRHQINQWKDVALVVDRVFFILYILLIVVSLATLFPRRQ